MKLPVFSLALVYGGCPVGFYDSHNGYWTEPNDNDEFAHKTTLHQNKSIEECGLLCRSEQCHGFVSNTNRNCFLYSEEIPHENSWQVPEASDTACRPVPNTCPGNYLFSHNGWWGTPEDSFAIDHVKRGLEAHSSEECAELCTKEDHCSAFVYSSWNLCYLYLKEIPMNTPRTDSTIPGHYDVACRYFPDSHCPAHYHFSHNGYWTAPNDRDAYAFEDVDHNTTDTPTIEACAELCTKTVSCQGFVYNQTFKNCFRYMKEISTDPSYKKTTAVQDTACYSRKVENCTYFPGNWNQCSGDDKCLNNMCKDPCPTDYEFSHTGWWAPVPTDNSWSSFKTNTNEQCAEECNLDNDCTAYDYHESWNHCYKYTNVQSLTKVYGESYGTMFDTACISSASLIPETPPPSSSPSSSSSGESCPGGNDYECPSGEVCHNNECKRCVDVDAADCNNEFGCIWEGELNECREKKCECPNGTPARFQECETDGKVQCAACEYPYSLDPFSLECEIEYCHCEHGYPRNRLDSCVWGDGCASCHEGYQLFHDQSILASLGTVFGFSDDEELWEEKTGCYAIPCWGPYFKEAGKLGCSTCPEGSWHGEMGDPWYDMSDEYWTENECEYCGRGYVGEWNNVTSQYDCVKCPDGTHRNYDEDEYVPGWVVDECFENTCRCRDGGNGATGEECERKDYYDCDTCSQGYEKVLVDQDSYYNTHDDEYKCVPKFCDVNEYPEDGQCLQCPAGYYAPGGRAASAMLTDNNKCCLIMKDESGNCRCNFQNVNQATPANTDADAEECFLQMDCAYPDSESCNDEKLCFWHNGQCEKCGESKTANMVNVNLPEQCEEKCPTAFAFDDEDQSCQVCIGDDAVCGMMSDCYYHNDNGYYNCNSCCFHCSQAGYDECTNETLCAGWHWSGIESVNASCVRDYFTFDEILDP